MVESISSPVSLSDIEFPSHTQSLSSILSELKRSTLSITNRLKSIETDSLFVQQVSEYYSLPLVANERCGSWYISPDRKCGSAYFKSTDGHTGQWDFSLRRLNLQVFDILDQHGGCIIVDSTRRGKAMPDALSKTVPIWSAVMNRTLFPDQVEYHRVQFPPDFLGASEESQIENRIDIFVSAFKGLGLDLDVLKQKMRKPIRLAWATRDYFHPEYSEDRDFHLMVLCSASKRVRGAEMSEGGYIQGAGDDSEGWACGLTPLIFWDNKETLLSAGEENLPEMTQQLIEIHRQCIAVEPPTLINPTKNIFIGRAELLKDYAASFDLLIDCHGDPNTSQRTRLNLGCVPGKLGSRNLRKVFGSVATFISQHFDKNPDQSLVIVCDMGKDLSAGTALMVLCSFFNEEGCYTKAQAKEPKDKQFIRKRLAWIVTSKHDVNPSRSTLQSVNSYLMERHD